MPDLSTIGGRLAAGQQPTREELLQLFRSGAVALVRAIRALLRQVGGVTFLDFEGVRLYLAATDRQLTLGDPGNASSTAEPPLTDAERELLAFATAIDARPDTESWVAVRNGFQWLRAAKGATGAFTVLSAEDVALLAFAKTIRDAPVNSLRRAVTADGYEWYRSPRNRTLNVTVP